MKKLKSVDKNNWDACMKLPLLPKQESNLAPNAYTIAESKFETHHHERAIYREQASLCHRLYEVNQYTIVEQPVRCGSTHHQSQKVFSFSEYLINKTKHQKQHNE